MKQLHLPALGPSKQWDDPACSWLTPAAGPAYYPHALISYYHWRKREALPFSANAYVVGDSGGYSMATFGAVIDPVDVMRWQIRQCTVGFILDFPPYGSPQSRAGANTGLRGHAVDRWDEALRRTTRHVQRALPLYEEARRWGTRFRWWGVLQGERQAQLAAWYAAVSAVYPFTDEGEGWAVKVHPLNNPVAIAKAVGFLAGRGVKRVHLLGGVEFAANLHAVCYESAGRLHFRILR